jgi:hypothetical protein
MEKKTIIYEAESMDDPVMEPASGATAVKVNPDKESDHRFLKTGIVAGAGLAAGVLGSYLAFKPDHIDLGSLFGGDESDKSNDVEIMVDKDMKMASRVNDSMSLEEAFSIARDEIGGGGLFMWNGQLFGTYTETEWGNLSNEEQKEFWSSVSISPYGEEKPATEFDFSDLQVATTVNDEMSFGEAFMNAREEVGAAGVFYWHGNPYNTFNKEEWAELSTEQKDDYLSNIVETGHSGSHEYHPNDSQYGFQNDNLNSGSEGQVFIAEPLNLSDAQNDNLNYAVSSGNDDVLVAGIPDQDQSNIILPPAEPVSEHITEFAYADGLEMDKLNERQDELNSQMQSLQDEADKMNVQGHLHKLAGIVDIGQQILNVGVDFGLVPGFASKIYGRVFQGAHLASDVGDSIKTLHDNP